MLTTCHATGVSHPRPTWLFGRLSVVPHHLHFTRSRDPSQPHWSHVSGPSAPWLINIRLPIDEG